MQNCTREFYAQPTKLRHIVFQLYFDCWFVSTYNKQMLRVLLGNIAHRSPLGMSELPSAMQQAMLRSFGGLYNQCCPQPLLMFVYYQIICSNINSTHCRMVFV